MAMTNIWFNPIFPVLIVLIVMCAVFALFVILIAIRGHSFLEVFFLSLRMFLIFACVFVINLRPMRGTGDTDLETRNLDVLFVVDTTISMWALDYEGEKPRMDGVIADCEYVMEKLAGANFGLIRFDNRAQILAPFTQDVRNIADAFDTIKAPDRSYATGSDLSAPILKMQELLKSSSEKEDRKTIIFYISDGEITNDKMLTSYRFLSTYVDNGAVLGYGTTAGGKMKEAGLNSYITDPTTDKRALSVLNEDNLRQVGQDLGIDYIYMDKQENIDSKLSYVLQMAHATVAQSKIQTFEDTYYLACIPLFILLAIELIRMIFVRKM